MVAAGRMSVYVSYKKQNKIYAGRLTGEPSQMTGSGIPKMSS